MEEPESESGQQPRRKKSLGQHFLNSGRTVNRIIAALNLTPETTVVETGPGRGALTRELYGKCAGLILLEKDHELIPGLKAAFPDAVIVECDATAIDASSIPADASAHNVSVGNLPYNVAGRILFNLLAAGTVYERHVLMFQKEVAMRFCARPGSRDFNAASALVSLMADSTYLFDVPPDRFIPPPKVMSGVVLFVPKHLDPERAFVLTQAFADFVHALFAQPRKTVVNSVMNGLKISRDRATDLLAAAGVNPACRPCELSGDAAVKMYAAYKA